MKDNRAKVIGWIGLSEGGFVDDPRDNGGRTNMGITQRTYDAWNRANGRKLVDVKRITKAEADAIVGTQYLDAVRFDDLPSGLDYSVADFAVNSGPARAVKVLQKLLGFTGRNVDGIIGAQTMAMIARSDLESLIIGYNKARMAYLKSLSDFQHFGKGWTARVMGKRDGLQTNDIGVIDRSVLLARGRKSIPEPEEHASPKTNDGDIRATNMIGKVLEDPIAMIPAIGTIITPLATINGPLAYALAAVIIIAGGYVAVRALRRGL